MYVRQTNTRGSSIAWGCLREGVRVARVVGEGIELIRREIVLVQQHRVLRRAGGALDT